MPQKNSWASYLGIAGQIGFIIAIPVVALTLFGRYLDRIYGTSPWFFLGGIIAAFLVSSAILYMQVWKALKFFAEEEEHQGGTATQKSDVETPTKKESTSILDTQKQYAEESKREIFEDSEFEDDEE